MAEIELTMRNGASWSLEAGEGELRRLVISLSRKMSGISAEVIRVSGQSYHNGVPHPVELHVRTDEIIGVRLRTPRRKEDERTRGSDEAEKAGESTRGSGGRVGGTGSPGEKRS